MPLNKFKYLRNYSESDEIKCAVCLKIITESIDKLEEKKLIYRTRIDKRLPGEKSHFKHYHVSYFFCSEKCSEEFFKESIDKSWLL